MSQDTKPDRRFMKGTEGNPDYMIVAQNGKIVLGVKPIFYPVGPAGTILACRIRSTATEATVSDGTVYQGTANHVVNAWPDIPFEKIDESSRASIVVGVLVNTGPGAVSKLVDGLAKSGAGREMCKWIMRRVPETYAVVSPDQMLDWIVEGWTEEIEPLLGASGPVAMLSSVDPISQLQDTVKEQAKKVKQGIKDKKEAKKQGMTVIETAGDGHGDSLTAAVAQAIGKQHGGGHKEGTPLLMTIFEKIDGDTKESMKNQLVNLLKAENLSVDPDAMWAEFEKWAAQHKPHLLDDPGSGEEGNVISLWGAKKQGENTPQTGQPWSQTDFEGSDGGPLPGEQDGDPEGSEGDEVVEDDEPTHDDDPDWDPDDDLPPASA